MQNLIICDNILRPDTWVLFEVESIHEKLMETYGAHKPANMRIYKDQVAEENDVTPVDKDGIHRLETLETVYAVNYPADPVTVIVAVVAVAATAAAAFLLRPDIPIPALRDAGSGSANNRLSDRTNRPRINGRIPDIFGKVTSIPDMIAAPYREFIDNTEIETSFMCIGRGEYEIHEVKDGITDVTNIPGTSIDIYGPNTSPNSGHSPQQTIGTAIGVDTFLARRLNEVNGQELQAPRSGQVNGQNDIRFADGGLIQGTTDYDFTELFSNGDTIVITNSIFVGYLDNAASLVTENAKFDVTGKIIYDSYDPTTDFTANSLVSIDPGIITSYTFNEDEDAKFTLAGEIVRDTGTFDTFKAGDSITIANATYTDGTTVDLDGTYTVLSVSGGTIALDDPASVNADWDSIDDFVGDETGIVVGTTFAGSRTVSIDLEGVYIISSVDATTITLQAPANVNANWGLLGDFQSGQSNSQSTGVTPLLNSQTVNLDGTYTATTVAATQITLSSPEAVNTDWDLLGNYTSNRTEYYSPTVYTEGEKWVGPFKAQFDSFDQFFINLVAPNGLYKSRGSQQYKIAIDYDIEVQALDASGTPTGSATTSSFTWSPDSTIGQKGITNKYTPPFSGPAQVRIRRTNSRPSVSEDEIYVDEVRWRDVYAMSSVTPTDFGDVTTVHAQTTLTDGALLVKERKLNLLVTRQIPTRVSGSTFTGSNSSTQSADEIIAHVCKDVYIGNRSDDEIDFDSIYDTAAAIKSHFANDLAGEFNYTFDSKDISFEETLAIIAKAVFATAYREAKEIKLRFEQPTEISTLLFNHRNILPRSESRTVRFGRNGRKDGVEVEWFDEDGKSFSETIPQGTTAVNPLSLQLVGVTNRSVALWLAWRAWYKLLNQNTAVEFQCTQEAALLLSGDRILVSDTTRQDTIEGEITDQVGLVITCSQDITLDAGTDYMIFLQHYDGSVESMSVTKGSVEANQVTLGQAPKLTLVTDLSNYARATFIIVIDDDIRADAYLTTQKNNDSFFTYSLQAINYDPLYYAADGIALWIPMFTDSITDTAGDQHDLTNNGMGAVSEDATRLKPVIENSGATDDITVATTFTSPDDYTKMIWYFRSGTGTCNLISSLNGTSDVLRYNSSNVEVVHDSTVVATFAAPAIDEWHHIAVTYDATSQDLALYIDGVSVATASSVAQRVRGQILIAENLDGRVDDIRVYGRPLSAKEINAAYKESNVS